MTENSLNDGYLIEKSKSLVWAKFKDWNARELRLLEVYLSRIDARRPDSSTVQFTLAEYGNLLGLAHLQYEQANNLVTKFISKSVSFERTDSKGRKSFKALPLFYEASCEMDDALGQYVIKIKCHPELEPVFFSLASDGYIKYRLTNTVKMHSQYSIILYGMLLDMMYVNGGWQIALSKLREQLGAMSKSYDLFKNFRRGVLEPAISEINAVTNITVTFSRIMSGRTCAAIHFNASYKDDKAAPEAEPQRPVASVFAELMPALSESQADKIGNMVIRKIKKLYPTIQGKAIEQAAQDIVKNAYSDLIAKRDNFPDNPGGYLWSVLSVGSTIDEYIPASYLF